jgi:large subunit ribosomal protein L29
MKVTEQRTELRGLSADELSKRARELEDQIFRLRIQNSMGQAEAGHKVRPLRKQIARILTVMREKGAKG